MGAVPRTLADAPAPKPVMALRLARALERHGFFDSKPVENDDDPTTAATPRSA